MATPAGGPVKVPRQAGTVPPQDLQTPAASATSTAPAYTQRKNAGEKTVTLEATLGGELVVDPSQNSSIMRLGADASKPAPEVGLFVPAADGLGAAADASESQSAQQDNGTVGVDSRYRHMYVTVQGRAEGLQRNFAILEEQLTKHANLPPQVRHRQPPTPRRPRASPVHPCNLL